MERQVTAAPHGHVLTNTAVWSADSRWIAYDVRSDPAGTIFDGDRIERVNVDTGAIQVLYVAKNNARCGVVTCHPFEDKVLFILGPEHPTADYAYGPSRRQGVLVDVSTPGTATNLDARDLAEPFTPGALRGGTHVHVFSPDARWVSFTYDDDLVSPGQRNVGVSLPGRPVRAGSGHPRNHHGSAFSVLLTRTTANPRPGSDEIRRAFEDGWVSEPRASAGQPPRAVAIAFQGEVVTSQGRAIPEVFIVDLPHDPSQAGEDPLEGTADRLPAPPAGCAQRRLTFTAGRKNPGLSGPRHWLRSSTDGRRIAFLMADDAGIVQLFTVPTHGGDVVQVTRNPWPVASPFTWSPDGRRIAHAMDASVCVTDASTGNTYRVTEKDDAQPPRPEACVFSPDGAKIAYVKTVDGFNQVFVADAAPLD